MLVWLAGCGSIRVLDEPTCYSDYYNTSVCEWKMDVPTNCSAQLHLSYQLKFSFEEEGNHTCVPENQAGTWCRCIMPMDIIVAGDTYQLDLWAGEQLLWNGSFRPSQHVKPKAPINLRVHKVINMWVLTWNTSYNAEDYLNELLYLVNVSKVDDPVDFKIYNITYNEMILQIAGSTLQSEAWYSARVKALAQGYSGTWSDWSASIRWKNYFHGQRIEERVEIGVVLSCLFIMVICVSCYCSIIKLKKEWWDQIPNPARSPLMAIIIQDSQVTLWKCPRTQETAKPPHWKTCLAKLLPCLLEHPQEPGEDPLKAAPDGAWRGGGGRERHPLEVSRMVLRPESICVEPVKLQEVPRLEQKQEEEEQEEEDWEHEERPSLCPEPSKGGFPGSREDIAARLAGSLFLDLLGAGDHGDLAEPGPPPPLGSQPSNPELEPWTTGPQHPAVVTDNPAYRSFTHSLSPDPQPAEGPGEGHPDVLPDMHPDVHSDVHPDMHLAPQLQPEPETWEALLRLQVLQHRGAPGGTGATGYKALPGLLACSAACWGDPGVQASGGGGYRPFQSLAPGDPGTPSSPRLAPLFTFGLDTEPPEGARVKPPPPPEAPPEELGSGVVYSALTCHLCGHLKQRHGQDDTPAAVPCCGCCCGDTATPLGSAPKAHLAPICPPPLGGPQEGKLPAPCLSQTPTGVAAMLSPGPHSTTVS